MDQTFTPVLFVCLSQKNGTRLSKRLDAVSKWVVRLAFETKTHILTFRGYEPGLNSHEHLILCVPDEELERFEVKLKEFRAWKNWRFKNLDFQRFQPEHLVGAFKYVLEGHTPLGAYVVCPKAFRSCRRGCCSHTDESIRRFANPGFVSSLEKSSFSSLSRKSQT